jgi:hypothetical protein
MRRAKPSRSGSFLRASLSATAVLLVVALSLALPTCGPPTDACTCFLCESAVYLEVSDAISGAPVTDFVVEAILNDVAVGEPDECTSEMRDPTYACSFGESAGVYHVIVRAPGYDTVEGVVRIAEEDESELCCRACLSAKPLLLAMTPST